MQTVGKASGKAPSSSLLLPPPPLPPLPPLLKSRLLLALPLPLPNRSTVRDSISNVIENPVAEPHTVQPFSDRDRCACQASIACCIGLIRFGCVVASVYEQSQVRLSLYHALQKTGPA
jgi:hypothetical protein